MSEFAPPTPSTENGETDVMTAAEEFKGRLLISGSGQRVYVLDTPDGAESAIVTALRVKYPHDQSSSSA